MSILTFFLGGGGGSGLSDGGGCELQRNPRCSGEGSEKADARVGMRKAGGRFVRVHLVFILQWQRPGRCMGARARRGPTAFRLLRPGAHGRRRRQLPSMQISRVSRPVCCPRYLSRFARYPSHLVNIYCPYPLTGSDAHRTRQGIAEDLTCWLRIHHSLESIYYSFFLFCPPILRWYLFVLLFLGPLFGRARGLRFRFLTLGARAPHLLLSSGTKWAHFTYGELCFLHFHVPTSKRGHTSPERENFFLFWTMQHPAGRFVRDKLVGNKEGRT
jgi:hypothetical protein